MRKTIGLLLTAAALAVGTANAQPIRPDTPSILRWTLEQQTDVVPRDRDGLPHHDRQARRPRAAPAQGRTIARRLTWSHADRSWTVDDYMKAYNVSGVMVVKDGKVMLERYGLGRKPEDRWISFSVTKSITSTLVGAAIKDGKIKSIDDQVTSYIPELKGSAYDGVTVRHLLTMSSGVKWNEDYSDPNSDVARAGATITEPGVNPIVSYMKALPRAHEPGTKFTYNTGETDLVGIMRLQRRRQVAVAVRLGKAVAGLRHGARRDLGGRQGGPRAWRLLHVHDGGRLRAIRPVHARRRCGAGVKILPDGWIQQATTAQITNGAPPAGYGYFWWLGQGGPYQASGIFGQSISVVPDERLVVVINSAWPAATGRELFVARSAFINAVRAAAKGL